MACVIGSLLFGSRTDCCCYCWTLVLALLTAQLFRYCKISFLGYLYPIGWALSENLVAILFEPMLVQIIHTANVSSTSVQILHDFFTWLPLSHWLSTQADCCRGIVCGCTLWSDPGATRTGHTLTRLRLLEAGPVPLAVKSMLLSRVARLLEVGPWSLSGNRMWMYSLVRPQYYQNWSHINKTQIAGGWSSTSRSSKIYASQSAVLLDCWRPVLRLPISDHKQLLGDPTSRQHLRLLPHLPATNNNNECRT